MRLKLLLPVGLAISTLALTADPGRTQSCLNDTITKVASSGKILMMQSGAVYEVLPGDEIGSMLWLPVSDVLVCARSIQSRGRGLPYYEIVKLDERGEKVGATRLR